MKITLKINNLFLHDMIKSQIKTTTKLSLPFLFQMVSFFLSLRDSKRNRLVKVTDFELYLESERQSIFILIFNDKKSKKIQ